MHGMGKMVPTSANSVKQESNADKPLGTSPVKATTFSIWYLLMIYVGSVCFIYSRFKGDQTTWLLPAYKVEKPFLHLQSTGRLGNQMFQYAALYAIANYTNRTPIAGERYELGNYFSKLSIPFKAYTPTAHIGEIGGMTFTPRLFTDLPDSPHVHMCCYFQSWKYFKHFKDYEKDLRAEFTIKDTYIKIAKEFISHVNDGLIQKHSDRGKLITYVGLHVRRSDFLWAGKYEFGHMVAPKSYIDKAMAYFRTKYNPVHFLVASDDVQWCKENLNYTDATITNKDVITDFTILTLCNHTIMTTGTFGWWAAWLAGGEVIYYGVPTRPGSAFEKSYKVGDHFLPNWTAMLD